MKRLFTLFAVVLAVLVSLCAHGNAALIGCFNSHVAEETVLVFPCADDGNPNTTEVSESPTQGVETVDLGLSVKWASCNIGATKPEEFGDYFAWGEVSPKKKYSVENSLTYAKDLEDISGDPQYDAATANWGGDWRMPTLAEYKELREKCSWKWIELNGVKGMRAKGPNGNTIFFPAAGAINSFSSIYTYPYGKYWTSTSSNIHENSACVFGFAHKMFVEDSDERDCGLTIRPVLD